ncbi:glycosyltransferase family 4 protein [Rummeliibacillus sp. JY-2-4R]
MKKKKDVLFLCQYFYPEYVSSATLPLDTALACAENNLKVGALCGYPKEYLLEKRVPLKENFQSIEINRLKYLQLKRSNFFGRVMNYFSFTFAVCLRFFDLRNYRAIIVYSNPPILPLIAAIANQIFGTKVIFVSYDIYPEIAHVTNSLSPTSFISKMMRFINRKTMKCVDKVVVLSNEMKAFMKANRPGLTNHQIEVIPNWYEDKEMSNSVVASKSKLFNLINKKKEGHLIVSYFGNMGVCQDLITIVEAIRGVKDDQNIQFIFAGHGNKMETLKTIVKSEELNNVKIFDFLHNQDYQDALQISDCFLVSLARDVTGLAVPSKTYGYMMAGKPVISIMGRNSDIAKDLIENNAGYAIEVGENDKLVNAIYELRDNRKKRDLMGKNCRNIFLEKYTKEICTQQYVKMIRKVLEET